MAEYTDNLGMFRIGTDPNKSIPTTLRDNFEAVDSKLGNSLTDSAGKKWNTLGERMNSEQTKVDIIDSTIESLKNRSVNVVLNHHYFRTISKQGATTFPPNTLLSYRYAAEWGYFGVMGDAQMSKDGKWIMFSDLTVDEKTDGTGAVKDKTFAELKALDVGSKVSGIFADVRMASFDDFLTLMKATQSTPFINLIGDYTDLQIKSLVDMIQSWGLVNDSAVLSNNITNLQKVRLYDKKIACGLYVSTHTDDILDGIFSINNSFAIYYDSQITEENMSVARTKGVPVFAWLATDTNDKLKEIVRMGVRGAFTRNPAIRGV